MTNLAIAETDDSARMAKAIDNLVSDDIRRLVPLTELAMEQAKPLIIEANDKRESLRRKAEAGAINADDLAAEAKVIQGLLVEATNQLVWASYMTTDAYKGLDFAVKYATGEY